MSGGGGATWKQIPERRPYAFCVWIHFNSMCVCAFSKIQEENNQRSFMWIVSFWFHQREKNTETNLDVAALTLNHLWWILCSSVVVGWHEFRGLKSLLLTVTEASKSEKCFSVGRLWPRLQLDCKNTHQQVCWYQDETIFKIGDFGFSVKDTEMILVPFCSVNFNSVWDQRGQRPLGPELLYKVNLITGLNYDPKWAQKTSKMRRKETEIHQTET